MYANETAIRPGYFLPLLDLAIVFFIQNFRQPKWSCAVGHRRKIFRWFNVAALQGEVSRRTKFATAWGFEQPKLYWQTVNLVF